MLDSITDHPHQEPEDCIWEDEFERRRNYEEQQADIAHTDGEELLPHQSD